ncbi:MAG: TIGR03032 family protein [Caldilineaceae bacterium]|nr:TIGR03032 family protein [Caldilineaceae bacterium]
MTKPTESPSVPAPELRSVYTNTLADLLVQLNLSLVVSTYQAGKVILVRYDQETRTVNTHFRAFEKPMGMAVHSAKGRLTIGGQKSVTYLRNMPAVARKLEPTGKHDACYLPREIHITGDIDIHEMGYDAADELWLVNTRFSCLCTLDHDHSFTPRWRPTFISAYAAEDRCHLNGLALVDGQPKYVTALGETDTAGGWRANKASGGILIDVATNEILLRGLSMPHSPHWHDGRLWFLEGGEGSLAWANLATHTWQTIAHLPGFTRGVDFYGPFAFIGLSQVRESATFSDLPIIERLGQKRTCGVWVVHLESGQTVGFLRFDSGVQEIFSVKVLPNTRYPEILEWNDPKMAYSYVLPDAALAETAGAERG